MASARACGTSKSRPIRASCILTRGWRARLAATGRPQAFWGPHVRVGSATFVVAEPTGFAYVESTDQVEGMTYGSLRRRSLAPVTAVFFLASILIFGFLRIMPGDAGRHHGWAGTRRRNRLRLCGTTTGWTRPIVDSTSPGSAMWVRGDLGRAFVSARPVTYLIRYTPAATLHLAIGT